jgi:hypothetical protein
LVNRETGEFVVYQWENRIKTVVLGQEEGDFTKNQKRYQTQLKDWVWLYKDWQY